MYDAVDMPMMWSESFLARFPDRFSYAYDANGNTLSDPSGKQYSWDFDNRLTQAIVPNFGTTTFRYDPWGRRIQKSGPLGTTNFLYDADNVIEEVDQSGNALARYSQHGEMDQPLSAIRSGTVSYYQQDGLGSVSSLSNSSGTLANTYTYDSFGNVTSSTGTLVNPLRYTAREFDLETGIYEYRMRYYDPSIGRFISEDPIGFKGGVDFYAYVNNRPINLADPTGLKPCGPDCTKADPLPSNSPKCDNYGSETYLGASEKCFCKCAGDSAWAQKVRGCLACAFENGQSKTGRHKMCYDAAGWGDAPYRTLINCERKCLFSH
jgi:RHS repeat-associated protein